MQKLCLEIENNLRCSKQQQIKNMDMEFRYKYYVPSIVSLSSYNNCCPALAMYTPPLVPASFCTLDHIATAPRTRDSCFTGGTYYGIIRNTNLHDYFSCIDAAH